jgi:adenine phosphoribosyltransferase
MNIQPLVKVVYDFPFKGRVTMDMSPLYTTPEAFNFCVSWLTELVKSNNIEHIVAIETRGFLTASAVAYETKLPLHLVRKTRLMPGEFVTKDFTQRQRPYTLSLSKTTPISGNVMIFDDIVASGSTLNAVGEMLTEHWNIAPKNQLHTALVYSVASQGEQMLLDAGYMVSYLVKIDC